MAFNRINRKLLLIKMHYFIAIAASASIHPFLSTMLRQRGYSPVIVGWIFTVLPIPSLLIKPLVGGITDKYKCRKMAIILNAIVGAMILCVQLFTPGASAESQLDDADVIRSPLFWLFSIASLLYLAGNMMRAVLEDTICIDLLGEDSHKYGKQRMWGSIGWGTISIVAGFCVDWYSKGQKYKNYTPAFIIALIFQILDVMVLSKIEVIQNTDSRVGLSDVKNVFKQIKVIAFHFWVMSFGVLCAIIWYYVFWYLEDLSNMYHPEMKSWIKTIQGFSLTVQCFGGEIPMFFISSAIIKRVGHMNVFSLMFFTFAVRFFLYSIIKNPVWVLPVEILNGPTFALTYSAAISYAAHIAPPGTEGTIQGILGTVFLGIGSPFGSLVGGYLFDHFGSIISFKVLSGISLTMCIIQVIVKQLIHRLSKDKNSIKESQKATVLYLSVRSKNENEEKM